MIEGEVRCEPHPTSSTIELCDMQLVQHRLIFECCFVAMAESLFGGAGVPVKV